MARGGRPVRGGRALPGRDPVRRQPARRRRVVPPRPLRRVGHRVPRRPDLRAPTGYPPQVPGVSGFPLGYHLGPDLVRAAAWRFAGRSSLRPDRAARRDARCLGPGPGAARDRGRHRRASPGRDARRHGRCSPPTSRSCSPANPQAHWWADLLRGNLLVSLALSNPIVPALALALGALVALARHLRGRGPRLARARRAAGARGPLLQGVPGRAPVARPRPRRSSSAVAGRGARLVVGARRARDRGARAGPGRRDGRRRAGAARPRRMPRAPRSGCRRWPALALARLVALLWIAASLGLRLVAPTGGRARAARWTRGATALAAMALAAWPLGLLFRVSAPEVLPGQKVVNDAAYLVEQGGAAAVDVRRARARTLARGAAATPGRPALGAAGRCPSTLQFAVEEGARCRADPVPAPTCARWRGRGRASRPGDVVLQRPGARYPPLPVVLAGRRVPYERFTPYLTQFVVARGPASAGTRPCTASSGPRTRTRRGPSRPSSSARFVCLYGQRPRALRSRPAGDAAPRGSGGTLPRPRGRGSLAAGGRRTVSD